MAKLKNTALTAKQIQDKVVRSIQASGKTIVDNYLKDMLFKQVDSSGDRFPKKTETTKKIYRAKGWNEDQWLIRTGEATKLNYTNTQAGLAVRPNDPEDVLQYVSHSDTWFTLNNQVKADIVEQVKKDLNK